MREVLRIATFRRLFAAQVASLVGTGLTTVALALLAYDLAGKDAGLVVGIALALRVGAFVVCAPVIVALTATVDRRRLLVALDVVRAGTVALMPFVDAVWQVYVLIFVLNAASAGFTPTFQATIPDVVDDPDRYTSALVLSRVAYEIEAIASPALAAALLTVLTYDALFVGNAVAFAVSAALVLSVALPARRSATTRRDRATITRGVRRLVRVPSLRGLLALDVAVAAASAMVIVNTVVLVRDGLELSESVVAVALGVSGAGALLGAVAMPRLLERRTDRTIMLAAGTLLAAALAAVGAAGTLAALLALWFAIGVGLALVQTNNGRLIQAAAGDDDASDLFAAHFSLSHACWLLTYPLAGALGAVIGTSAVALVLSALAAGAVLVAARVWPRRRPRVAAAAGATTAIVPRG